MNGQVVTVDVTNATGCAASYGPLQIIKVNDLPTGTLQVTETSGAHDDGTICKNSPVTFTATSGYNNYKFYINGNAIPVQDGAASVYTTSNLNDQDEVSVMATSAAGCSTTFNKIKITVVDAPTGTLTASDPAICAGGSITLTALPAGLTNYNFKRNGVSFSNGNSNTATVIPLVSTDKFTVEVSNSQTCMTVFGPVSVTVNPLPTGTLLITETSGKVNNDGIICKDANVTFTAPLGFTNYNFKINDVTVRYDGNNTYSSSSLKNGDVVSVEVTNAANCVATLNSFAITVNDLPAVQPITAVTTTVCVNSHITLIAATSGGTWSSSKPLIATVDASGVVTGVGAGIATISYKVTNLNNCDSIVSIDVTVNALPVVAAISGASKVCVGDITPLTETTPGGIWSSGNDLLATVDASGLVTGVAAGTVTISYTVTNAEGCVTVVTKSITVNALPVVGAIGGTLKVCVDGTTTLTNTSAGGVWTSSDNAIATITASGVVKGISGGTVTIYYTVFDGNGCSATVQDDVLVNTLPVPTLTGPNPICPNTTETYTTESDQSNYSWTVVGGAKTAGGGINDDYVTILWGATGTKSVFVNYENANGCAANTSVTINNGSISSPTIAGDVLVCQNTSGHIYTTQPNKDAYTWSITGGTITSGMALNQ